MLASEVFNKGFWKKQQNNNWFVIFTPVLVTILLTEAVVNLLMLPSFDTELSSLKYTKYGYQFVQQFSQSWLF